MWKKLTLSVLVTILVTVSTAAVNAPQDAPLPDCEVILCCVGCTS